MNAVSRISFGPLPSIGWMGLFFLIRSTRWPTFSLDVLFAVDADVLSNDEGPTDVELVRRVADGDGGALQTLFDRWKLPLVSFFYRSLGSREEAEDLTLTVFVRLHGAAGRYREEAGFSTYLFQIARRLLINEIRRRRRGPVVPVPPEDIEWMAAKSDDEKRRLGELEEIFSLALNRLPEKYRTPLLLTKQQDLSQQEIARILSISENSLRVLLHRGRMMLKKEMGRLQ